ncbi:hypothetical protein H4S03_000776 [Coemansia sp. S3946]|nr:hypothetical protein H4S03_000776 [Coemansia sp. S3946]
MSAQDESSSRESSVDVPMMSTGADGSSTSKARSSTSRSTGSVRYLRACDNCRRRKVKCDGVRPSCGHCNRVEVPCHYSIKPKSRRMWKCLEDPDGTPAALSAEARPSRASAPHNDGSQADDTTAWLMARVETMERLLMQRNIGNSPRIPQPMALNDEGAAQHGSISSTGAIGAAAQLATMGSTPGGMALRGLMMDIGNAQGANNSASGNNGAYSGVVPSKRDNEHLSADPGYPPQLANMLAPPAPHTPHTPHTSSNAEAHSQHASGPLSLEVIKHLIDTLFAHPNYIVEVLHEETFRRQFAAGTLSPLLLFSSLASAARYSKHPAVRTEPPYSASAVYINRAKLLVIDAIEEPSLGNAQGLMIMCMMNFALGNETVTTFYKAMALNMCILLGFNRLDSIDGPVQPHSNCGGGHEHLTASTMAMDWVDREAARRLWWTMFSIENYSSVCMGLTPSIQAEYCDVNLPASTLEWEQGHPTNPVAANAADAGNPAKRPRVDVNPVHMLAAYHAQLSLIFSKVAWLVTRTNSSAEDAVAQFSELNSVLQRWYEGLPKELRLSSVDTLLFGHQDSNEYYHICVLHMRFYTTVIQLNHAIPEFSDDPAVIEPGQRKCVIAASRISDLLRTSFEIPVELRDMNWYMCVFRAAHIHIYRLLSRDSESIARAKQDLAIHRRHLREGGPLWRICNKLMSRLDDMEQMVMLLPAQIPVADLIRLKNLTRKGKSQLVNMQLDALIKPNLIQAEGGDNSDDLPLLARAEMAGNIQQQPNIAALQSRPPRQSSLGASDVQTSPLGMSMSSTAASLCGILDQATSNASPLSTVIDGSSSSHSTLNPFASMGSLAGLQLNKGSPDVRFTTGGGGNGFTSSSPSPSLIMPALDHPHGKPMALHHQQQHQQHSNSILSGPLLPPPSGVTPINTGLVIDNNMAETLVNYFYMVASNQSQQQQQPQPSARSGSTNSLASPGMPMMSSAGLTMGGNVTGAMLPSLPSMMPLQQQQQHQQLFGHMYDPSGIPGLSENNGSFV